MNPYHEAHVFVAAIRLVEFRKKGAPTMEEVCSMLEISMESGHALGRKLKKLGVVELSEDPFTVRLSVADHLQIEKIEKKQDERNGLAKELESFKAKKKDMDKKVEEIQAELARKRKDLFSNMEQKLKKEIDEKKGK